MQLSILLFLSLSILLCGCQQPTKTLPQAKEETKSIIIDSAFQDTVKRHIRFTSGSYFSNFNTPIETRFFKNSLQTASIIKSDFHMISWYSNHGDTVDLVAHVGEFETEALLIRFLKDQPTVLFFRAPHDIEGSKYFRIAKADTFAHKIEVMPIRYQLKPSEIPDTINKQVVYGYIDLESNDYYDKRDTAGQPHKIQMKFYFRSQYRKFDYLHALNNVLATWQSNE